MGLFTELVPEQVVSRKLAGVPFGGTKPLSKAVRRVGTGQIHRFDNGAWLSVKLTTGGTVFKVLGRDDRIVTEAVQKLRAQTMKPAGN